MQLSKKEKTQLDIINAAKTIVHEKGHSAITVRNLAEITGYAYTHLYYYFKDLDDLLWTLRNNMIIDMIDQLSAEVSQAEDPIKEIILAFSTYSDYFFEHPNVFRFFYFHPFVKREVDHSYNALEQKFEGLWQSAFSRLVIEGILKPTEIERVAKTIIFALQGMIMLSLSSNGSLKQADVKEELDKLVHYLLERKI